MSPTGRQFIKHTNMILKKGIENEICVYLYHHKDSDEIVEKIPQDVSFSTWKASYHQNVNMNWHAKQHKKNLEPSILIYETVFTNFAMKDIF